MNDPEIPVRFGKRENEMPGVLRFGKRRTPGVLRFDKRFDSNIQKLLQFNKRLNNNDMPGVFRFGK